MAEPLYDGTRTLKSLLEFGGCQAIAIAVLNIPGTTGTLSLSDPYQMQAASMPISPNKSLWDVFALMVEKSTTYTVITSGAVLILATLFLIFLVLAISPGLRNFLRELLRGIRYAEGKLAYDGSTKLEDAPVETDEKGNVKPPSDPAEVPTSSSSDHPEQDQFYWLFLIQAAYHEPEDSLGKISEYYQKAQISAGQLPAAFLEAEYLLARFKCGDSSALTTLIEKAGASTAAYSANGTLADYYESIGEIDQAKRYLEYRFLHAPDNEKKLFSVRRLANFLADNGCADRALLFVKEQLPHFKLPEEEANLWKTLGEIYDAQKQIWQKHLCFERALRLDANNTSLRFSLAYSYSETTYGGALAAHHYGILLKQRPSDTMASNNLSVIYDDIGATSKKISLLRQAALRRDNSYVASNLASGYARAGFTDDARKCLEQVPLAEQQEPIVRRAYREIEEQIKADEGRIEKLGRLVEIEKRLLSRTSLDDSTQPAKELIHAFVGEWSMPDGTKLSVEHSDKKLTCQLTTQSDAYEHASYITTARYEPGLLEIKAELDEKSLKPRPSSGTTTGLFGSLGMAAGFGTNSLLGLALSRPADALVIMLVPGEEGSLRGVRATGNRADFENRVRMLLTASEISFTRAQMLTPREAAG